MIVGVLGAGHGDADLAAVTEAFTRNVSPHWEPAMGARNGRLSERPE